MNSQSEISGEPIYNIRSVVERTGIAAETIRAWERRYGYPKPHRSPNGYRLYTADEIATLLWLKNQTDSGMSIGQSIQLLEAMRARGQEPTVRGGPLAFPTGRVEDPTALADSLFTALVSFDEEGASSILRRGFAGLPIDKALLDVIAPTLVKIGQAWHDGEIPVAIEHFSTQLCRAHIIHTMEATPVSNGKGRIVAACAPGEWHEIGLLMVTFLLRNVGWEVTYLGANLPLEKFGGILTDIQPVLVLFSASSSLTAENLSDLVDVLNQMAEPRPLIGLGGQAFLLDPTLANRIPGTFFGPKADDAVRQIENMLVTRLEDDATRS